MSKTTAFKTKIYHYFRSEVVYEHEKSGPFYTDVGVMRPIEHWDCDACGCKVDKNSKSCPRCRREFTGIREDNTSICQICGEVFEFDLTDSGTPPFCRECDSIFKKCHFTSDFAKAFFAHGKAKMQAEINKMNNAVTERIPIPDSGSDYI